MKPHSRTSFLFFVSTSVTHWAWLSAISVTIIASTSKIIIIFLYNMCFREIFYFKWLAEYTQNGRRLIFGGKTQLFQCRDFRKGLFLIFSSCKSTKSQIYVFRYNILSWFFHEYSKATILKGRVSTWQFNVNKGSSLLFKR